MSGHLLLYGLIAAMVVLWSANFIIAKVALREFPPLLLSGLRIALAGLFIAPVYLWDRGRTAGERNWSRQDAPILMFLGTFGVALNQLFFVLGISLTSIAHSAIFISVTPILVLLMAAASGQERLTPRKMSGMAIALGGVAVLNLSAHSPASGGPTLLGDFFIFLASLTFALFTVFGRDVTLRHGSVTVNTFAYVGAALALSPITLWQARWFAFRQVSLEAWAGLIYMALFPSVVCYLIYFYALSHISPSRVAAFSYFQPLLATAMAVLILGERITVPLAAGGSVIFAGVYLTERG